MNIVKAIQQAAGELARASRPRSWLPRRRRPGRLGRTGRGRLSGETTTMTTEADRSSTSPEIGGMGHSVKRKEDPRFIRGQGEYIDDVNLPGQLWLDIVRSPYAHATIKVDRRDRGAQDPGRRSRSSPARTSEGYKLALDADPRRRHADGAAGRHRHVPVAGGRGGHRHHPLRRRRRRRRGPRRLRAAAGHRRPAQGARGGRVRPPPGPRRRTSRPTTSGTGNRATRPRPTRPSPRPR